MLILLAVKSHFPQSVIAFFSSSDRLVQVSAMAVAVLSVSCSVNENNVQGVSSMLCMRSVASSDGM